MEQIIEQKTWFDRNYKLILLVPVIIMVLCLVYLYSFNSKHGDFLYKDITLSGGTTLTINDDFDTSALESALKAKFSDMNFRKLTDITTGKQIAFIVETSASPEQLKPEVEKVFGQLTEENSSMEFTGPTLSDSFYKQLLTALAISFILMSIVIFVLFKSFIPSIAVIFAAFGDIVMPLALLNFLEIKISAAGIAAFLMLIGYSVDTDILLTTRALKKSTPALNLRIFSAFKTGTLMTGTALAAVLPAFFIISGLPDSFRQIFLILSLGLIADLINTWMTNMGIIKWYCDARGIQ